MPCRPHVIDTSAIIQIKRDVEASKQWELLKRMEELTESGSLCFPREVSREVKNISHPDAPGVWVHGVERKNAHPVDPSDEAMRHVMGIAGEVVDPDQPINGDAQVLAIAHDLREAGHHPTVVSEDHVDRGEKLSVQSGCGRLGLPHIRLADFLQDVASDFLT